MTRQANTLAVRGLLRALALGALMVAGMAGSSSAQEITDVMDEAIIVPANISPDIARERLALRPSYDATEPAATELTTALLQGYVDRQQKLRTFDGFEVDADEILTTDVLMGYIARTRGSSNAALAAIEGADSTDQPALTEEMLARYVGERFVPTEKRLKLAASERLCLTQAIYHEARGESEDGQWAVANVIINRAFSGKYPTTICGVVFQNADKGRYRCQFTFACDGRSDMGKERRAWARAERMADAAYRDFVTGERPNVLPGSVLFYHTRAVAPSWSRSFKRVATIGSHIFYAAH